jgi:hypothetical protein
VRLYAPSRLEKLVPEKIFEISNFHPSHANAMEDMMKYKIVVVTLVTAGKLASAGKFILLIGRSGRPGRSGRTL